MINAADSRKALSTETLRVSVRFSNQGHHQLFVLEEYREWRGEGGDKRPVYTSTYLK